MQQTSVLDRSSGPLQQILVELVALLGEMLPELRRDGVVQPLAVGGDLPVILPHLDRNVLYRVAQPGHARRLWSRLLLALVCRWLLSLTAETISGPLLEFDSLVDQRLELLEFTIIATCSPNDDRVASMRAV